VALCSAEAHAAHANGSLVVVQLYDTGSFQGGGVHYPEAGGPVCGIPSGGPPLCFLLPLLFTQLWSLHAKHTDWQLHRGATPDKKTVHSTKNSKANVRPSTVSVPNGLKVMRNSTVNFSGLNYTHCQVQLFAKLQ